MNYDKYTFMLQVCTSLKVGHEDILQKLGQANMDMFNTSSSQKCKVCYQKCTTYLLVLSCRNWKFIFSYDTGECEKRLQK